MPTGNPAVRLGSRRYDLTRRCLVMGIVSGTPDLSSDQGATSALDAALRRAEAVVAEGADMLEVDGANLVEALARFDVPVSVRTSDAGVVAAACAAGAVVAHDPSGFSAPDYLRCAVTAGATVVANVTGLTRARAAGLAADQIILDTGVDLGRTAALAGLGHPLLLSAVGARRVPSLSAVAYGVSHGCRIVRVHDVAGTVRVVRLIERILAAEAEA